MFKQFTEIILHFVKMTTNFKQAALTELLLCHKLEVIPNSGRFCRFLIAINDFHDLYMNSSNYMTYLISEFQIRPP